jgi:hypothetical protein
VAERHFLEESATWVRVLSSIQSENRYSPLPSSRAGARNSYPQEIYSMKIRNSLPLSFAAAFFACLVSQPANAQEMKANPVDRASMSLRAGTSPQAAEGVESAKQLVPAEAELTRTLDARKDQAGSTFEARLRGTVHLKDGTELPRGTLLMGKVATDDMRNNGVSQLSLFFTDAKLKDGKTVPIEATIVGITDPAGSENGPGANEPTPWDGTSVQYDDVGVLSHVDLHSRIGGANSGTLVASDKSDMKLRIGCRLSLAIGENGAS